jgi:hypothetical protein
MKKKILAIVLSLAILTTLVSCNVFFHAPPIETTLGDQQTTGMDAQNSPKEIWEKLQELSQQKYNKVNLNIKTVTGDIELNANYTLSNTDVTYSVEQLNLLPSNGDMTNVSPNAKTTLSGSAIIKNGRVEKIDGKTVTIPSYNELRGVFNFKESNFKNVKMEKGKLTADVSSVFGFMGTSQNLRNMKIVVTYSDTALQKLEITYNTTNSTVTTVYEFTK